MCSKRVRPLLSWELQSPYAHPRRYILSAFVLAVTILFGSLVWHLARMCFVQVHFGLDSYGVVAVCVAFAVTALI